MKWCEEQTLQHQPSSTRQHGVKTQKAVFLIHGAKTIGNVSQDVSLQNGYKPMWHVVNSLSFIVFRY
jgi:hypothetical protein